jgi:membrane-associated phospholipid phosphatase
VDEQGAEGVAAPMTGRTILLVHAAAGAMLAVFGIACCDVALAGMVRQTVAGYAGVFEQGTHAFDLVLGRHASQFLIGALLLMAGAVLCTRPASRGAGRRWLYVANVQLSATLLASVLKTAFGRLRPYEVLAGGHGDATWFAGGDSFPSGHAAFYFGLVLPIVALWPKRAWPLLALAWFIGAARVVGGHHFPGDVGASIAVAALLALALRPIAGDASRA